MSAQRLGSGLLTGLILAIYAWELRACGHLGLSISCDCPLYGAGQIPPWQPARSNSSPDITGNRGTTLSLLQLHIQRRMVVAHHLLAWL